jgi:hypothetical protein
VLFKDGVERHSRFAMLIKVPSKARQVVVAACGRGAYSEEDLMVVFLTFF